MCLPYKYIKELLTPNTYHNKLALEGIQMKKKVFRVCIVVVLSLVFFACDGGGDGGGGYNFIDQDLKGMIDGVSWTYEGTAIGGSGENFAGGLYVEIYSDAAVVGNPCGSFPAGSKVLFTIPGGACLRGRAVRTRMGYRADRHA